MRQVTLDMLDCVDGCYGTNRWIRRADAPAEPDPDESEHVTSPQTANGDSHAEGDEGRVSPVHLTQLARSLSRHRQGHSSQG